MSGNSRVVGYDADGNAQTLAQRMGAVDTTEWNIDRAVEDADMIIVSTQAGALYDVFEAIGPFLKEDAVVTDTSPAKRAVLGWADELLPRYIGFVGGNPLTGAAITEQKNASGHIFHEARWAVVAPPTAPPHAIRALTDLIEGVGARPVFMDAHEHDSFSAATTGLPAVVAAAVMNAVSGSPSWAEISRFVGNDFDQVTSPASTDPASSQSAAATNSDMLVHWIDQLIERFQDLRRGLEDEEDRFSPDGAVADLFVQAWEQRARLEAGVADRRPEAERLAIPSSGDSMMGMFFGSRVARVMTGGGKEKKKDPTKYDRRKM
jgi:prephenate dehydrogenase